MSCNLKVSSHVRAPVSTRPSKVVGHRILRGKSPTSPNSALKQEEFSRYIAFSALAEQTTSTVATTEELPGIRVIQWPDEAEGDRHVRFLSSEETGKPEFFSVKGMLRIPAGDPALVWKILTAYESCPDIFSNIKASSIIVNDGKLEVLQKCVWSFLAFSGDFDAHLAVDEDHEARKLVFKLIQSSFMRDFEGRWNVHVSDSSSNSGIASEGDDAPGAPTQDVIIEHVLSVKPAVPVPPPFSYYTRSIFVKQVDGVLQDLQREIDRQSTGRGIQQATN